MRKIDIFLAVISFAMCILSIISISIIAVYQNQNKTIEPGALQAAEVLIGIVLASTGAYACWSFYKYRTDESSSENLANTVFFGILCALNIVAMAVLLIETSGISVDPIALQIGEAAVGITLVTALFYGISYSIKASDKKLSEVKLVKQILQGIRKRSY